jgi:hypothetical protein
MRRYETDAQIAVRKVGTVAEPRFWIPAVHPVPAAVGPLK